MTAFSATISNFNSNLFGVDQLFPEDKKSLDEIFNTIQNIFLTNTSTDKIKIQVRGGESRVTNTSPFEKQGSLAEARATTVLDYIRTQYPKIWNSPLLGLPGGTYSSISPPGSKGKPVPISCRKNFEILKSEIGNTTWINNTAGTPPPPGNPAKGTINPPKAAWGNKDHPVYTKEQFIEIIVEYESKDKLADPCAVGTLDVKKKVDKIPNTGLLLSYPFPLYGTLRKGKSITEKVTGTIELYVETFSFPDYIQVLFFDDQGNINKKGIIPLNTTNDVVDYVGKSQNYGINVEKLMYHILNGNNTNPIFNYLPQYQYTPNQGSNKKLAMMKSLYENFSYCIPDISVQWKEQVKGYPEKLINGIERFFPGEAALRSLNNTFPMFYTPTVTPTLIPPTEKINPTPDKDNIYKVYTDPSTAPPNAVTVPIISCSIVESVENPTFTAQRANPQFSSDDPTYNVAGSVPYISGSRKLLKFDFDSSMDKHMLIQVFGYREETNFSLEIKCN